MEESQWAGAPPRSHDQTVTSHPCPNITIPSSPLQLLPPALLPPPSPTATSPAPASQPQSGAQGCWEQARFIPLPPSPSQGSICTRRDTCRLPLCHSSNLLTKPPQAYLRPCRGVSSPSSPSKASTETLNECCAPLPAQKSPTATTMGLSKTHRIIILLGIDSAFFLVELIVGKWRPCRSATITGN